MSNLASKKSQKGLKSGNYGKAYCQMIFFLVRLNGLTALFLHFINSTKLTLFFELDVGIKD